MTHVNRDPITRMARRYVWWKTPEEAAATPRRVIAQVMDIGDYADVQALASEVGEAVLAEVLANAEAGEFHPRSWTYWHYRLGLATSGRMPPMPVRKVA